MTPSSTLPTLPTSRARLRGRVGRILALLLVLSGAILAADLWPDAHAYDEPAAAAAETTPEYEWPEAVIDVFGKLPVQDGGRIKPLLSWSNYTLLRMNFRRSVRTPQGRKISSVEWMLDVMFRPEAARNYHCFLVETRDVVSAIGVEVEGRKKRDRYSFEELKEGRAKLETLAREYAHKNERDLTAVEGGIVALYHSFLEFEGLLLYLDFARKDLDLSSDPALIEAFGGKTRASFSEVVATAPGLLMQEIEAGGSAVTDTSAFRLLQSAARLAQRSRILRLFAPSADQAAMLATLAERGAKDLPSPEEWLTPWDIVGRTVQMPVVPVSEDHVAMLGDFETMMVSLNDMKAFESAAVDLGGRSYNLTDTVASNEKLGLEVFLFRDLNPFYRALAMFIAAFILVSFTWIVTMMMGPGGKGSRGLRMIRTLLELGIWLLVTIGAFLVVWGIWIRCLVRERPPVSTLYETVIFIAAFVVIACLIIELINKKRIALALAPILGALLLFVANRYEMVTKEDTMPQLVAVLDTNFWLATHVTSITIGYGASLLTAFVAHIYVLGKVFGMAGRNREFYRTLGRMVYGMLAFALFFSVIGTILGGIWANDSWGRFWGWDPKENGALLIVLWQLAMLHAALGRYIKPFGFNMAAVVLAAIVSFSWWGVNLLGIGLHSYGFAKGVWTGLVSFYILEFGVLAAGAAWRLLGVKWFVSIPLAFLAMALFAVLVTGSWTASLVVLAAGAALAVPAGLIAFLVYVVRQGRTGGSPQPG